MTFQSFILHNGAGIAFGLRVISSIQLLLFCIPLQVKEVRVHNGLRKLRIQLLCMGLIILIVNIITAFVLGDVFFNHRVQQPLNAWLQIINAVAFNILACVGQDIYRTQYSDENIEHHEKVERLEQEADKKTAT